MEDTIRLGRRTLTNAREFDRHADQMLALAYRVLLAQSHANQSSGDSVQDGHQMVAGLSKLQEAN